MGEENRRWELALEAEEGANRSLLARALEGEEGPTQCLLAQAWEEGAAVRFRLVLGEGREEGVERRSRQRA